MIKKLPNILISPKSVFIFSICYLALTFATFTFITARSPYLTWASYAIFVYGLLIIISTILNFKRLKTTRIHIVLFLFIISNIVSLIFAYKYGLSENVKGLIWLTLEVVAIYFVSPKSHKDKYLNYFLYIFVYINLAYAIFGIIMALFGYMYYPSNMNSNDLVPGGIAHGRLYGLYADPNYGAISSCIAIFSSIYICIHNKIKIETIWMCVINLILVIFISLTGSRTALVALLVASFICVFLIIKRKLEQNKEKFKSVILSLLSAVLSCSLLAGIMLVTGPIFEEIELNIYKVNNGPITNPKDAFTVGFADRIRTELNIADPYEINSSEQNNNKIETNRNIASDDVNESHSGLIGRDTSQGVTNNRIQLWKDAITLFTQSPIIGLSNRNYIEFAKDKFPELYTSQESNASTHNNLLDVLVSQGVIGLILWSTFLVLMLVSFVKLIIKSRNNDYFKYSVLFSMFILICTSAMFYSEIIYVNTIASVFFWYVFGHLPYGRINILKIKK